VRRSRRKRRRTKRFVEGSGIVRTASSNHTGMHVEHRNSHGFRHIFAFTARGLIPSILTSFLVDVAQKVIVDSADIDTFLISILDSAPSVARHTAVIHITNKDTGVEGSRYVWSSSQFQPWAQHLPVQCPTCFSFRPWPRDGGKKGVNSCMVFKCQGRNVDDEACKHELRFEMLQYKAKSKSGMWFSFNWP
jgi:hypothetical protein